MKPNIHDMIMQATDLRQDIQNGIERSLKLIQLDECVITKKTIGTHVWTLPKTNISLDPKDTNTKVKAVIIAISREKGIEAVQVYEKSVNKQKFKMFLHQI